MTTDTIEHKEQSNGTIIKKALTKDVLNFSGVAGRKEYWLALISIFAISILFLIIGLASMYLILSLGDSLGYTFDPQEVPSPLLLILVGIWYFVQVYFTIYLSLVALSVSARRFRDQGRSPNMALLTLIPVVNIITFIMLGFIGSKLTDNPYRK